MNDWFEEDLFWESFAPFIFGTVRTEEMTPAEVDQILERARPEPGSRVLDLCCGQGRHCLELARRGFRVTGVDRTETYLRAARERAAALGLQIEFVQDDMRRFRREGAFDLALNLFTSFGYFSDPGDDGKVLRHLHDSLAPGGRLLMDMSGKEPVAREFQPRTWHRLPGHAGIVLEEAKVLDGWSGIESRWILLQGGDRREATFRIRLYSGSELAARLRESGFEEVRLFGSLEGAPYDQEAKRLVAMARKPGA